MKALFNQVCSMAFTSYIIHEHFKKPFNLSFHSFIRIWQPWTYSKQKTTKKNRNSTFQHQQVPKYMKIFFCDINKHLEQEELNVSFLTATLYTCPPVISYIAHTPKRVQPQNSKQHAADSTTRRQAFTNRVVAKDWYGRGELGELLVVCES